jgi:ABC-type xylose transport system permease subunit
MANIKHPNFILAIVAIILGLVSIGFRSNSDNSVGDILSIAAAVLAIVSWIWSIFEVQTTNTLQGSQRKFWRIAVIAIPFAGGIIYHLMHSKRNTIVD